MSYDLYLVDPATKNVANDFDGQGNITSNLSPMFREALGMTLADLNGMKAADCVPILEKAVADMKARPEHYKQFNAPNGWGLYMHALPWLGNVLDCCRKLPSLEVNVTW